MNRSTSMMVLALFTAAAGGAALAQDAQQTQKQAQPQSPAVRSAGEPSKTTGAQAPAGSNAVRNWEAIDTNHDKLIQPEEMEAALKEAGPQAKPAKR